MHKAHEVFFYVTGGPGREAWNRGKDLMSLIPRLLCRVFNVLRYKSQTSGHRAAKGLAWQYGYSREEVKQVLREFAVEMKNEGNSKPLEPSYDYSTREYLSFEEWMGHYLKIWNRISG